MVVTDANTKFVKMTYKLFTSGLSVNGQTNIKRKRSLSVFRMPFFSVV